MYQEVGTGTHKFGRLPSEQAFAGRRNVLQVVVEADVAKNVGAVFRQDLEVFVIGGRCRHKSILGPYCTRQNRDWEELSGRIAYTL